MIISFQSATEFRVWLSKNQSQSDGIWLRIYKKGSEEKSVTYAEALDEALCFGWIDGQKRPLDAGAWMQKFTPRRPRGNWSELNTRHAARLIAAGRMMPAGLKEIEAAKADGRWKAAYASPSKADL